MNVDELVETSRRVHPRKGCVVCRLDGKPAEVIDRMEGLVREHGRDAVSASALARDPGWQAETGVGVYPLRDHFRECLGRS